MSTRVIGFVSTVAMLHPIKQGLKQYFSSCSLDHSGVAMLHPIKQGLKRQNL